MISRIVIFFSFVFAVVVFADEVTLSGNAGKFTGRVQSIHENGVTELVSPLSAEPLWIKGGMIEKIDFEVPQTLQNPSYVLIRLTNGDRVSAELLSLDDMKLTAVSPDVGRFEIPRSACASIQFGKENRRQTFRGSASLDEWSYDEKSSDHLTASDGFFVSEGTSSLMRTVSLPQCFILKFTLKWPVKAKPSYKIAFADPLKKEGSPCDRYLFVFNSEGVELSRETSKENKILNLVSLNRSPELYSNRCLNVEIHVDRKKMRMQLFLNGKPEGEFLDLSPSAPTGSGVSISMQAEEDYPLEVGHIEVFEDDEIPLRVPIPNPENQGEDSLISWEEDHWQGKLESIQIKNRETRFFFKSKSSTNLMEIPQSAISSICFASSAKEHKESSPSLFSLHLGQDTYFHITFCQLAGDAMTATHPLLGSLSIPKNRIVLLQKKTN